jgi:hypothetical protein
VKSKIASINSFLLSCYVLSRTRGFQHMQLIVLVVLPLPSCYFYMQDHKSDAEFLNKPLENYKEMFIVFGNNMATGKYAKGSSEALGTEDRNSMAETEIDEGDGNVVPSPIDDIGASSSAPRPRKKAKVTGNEEAGLIGAFKDGAGRLAMAIEKAGSDDLPPDLLQTLQSIPGFDDTHKAFYFAYLVKNPGLAR